MSLKAMMSLARVTRLRSACAPTSGLPKRVPDHPDRVTASFMIAPHRLRQIASILRRCRRHRSPEGCRVALLRRPGSEDCDLGLHRLAESLVAFGQFLERPVECADGIRGLEDRQGEAVPLFLELVAARDSLPESIAIAAPSASRSASEIPCEVSGSRKKPASPTSIQPGPCACRSRPGAPRNAFSRSTPLRPQHAPSPGASASRASCRPAARSERNSASNRAVGTEATIQASPSLVGITPPLTSGPKYQ